MSNWIRILLICILSSSSYATEKWDSIITGFWNYSFPTPSGEYGYIFTRSNKFIYFKTFGDNARGYYVATIGEWKIVENKLSLKAIKVITDQDQERSEAIVNNQKWTVFSDLRSINYYWHPDAQSNGFPPMIKIKEFDREISTPYVKDYFKFDNEDQSRLKHKFFFDLIDNISYNNSLQPTSALTRRLG